MKHLNYTTTFRNVRKSLCYATLVCYCLLLCSCAQLAELMKEPENPELAYPDKPPPLSYSFSYSPEAESNTLQATVALISPQYDSRTQCLPGNPSFTSIADDYARRIEADFESTLIAKGYSILGPFTSIDEMTFGEKEQAILALHPRITLSVRCEDGGSWEYSSVNRQRTGQTYEIESSVTGNPVNQPLYRDAEILRTSGNAVVQADIVLVMFEPLTAERVWQRTIEVEPLSNSYRYYRERSNYYVTLLRDGRRDVDESNHILLEYDERPMVVARALETAYQSQLGTFSRYFDPREIENVVGDAQRARALKRF